MISKFKAALKRDMPTCLMIGTATYLVRIVENFDGRLYPITWAIMIALVATTLFVIVSVLRLLWYLIKLIIGRG